MGCASSREQNIEESVIVQAEHVLRFTYLNVLDIDAAFRKYNCNGEVMQSHLIQTSKQLGFRIMNTADHMQIQQFYTSIRSEAGGYLLKDILLIAILLGRGKPEEKAKLVYEIFDTKCTHQLDIKDVSNEIVMRILSHCCKTLPELVEPAHIPAEHHMKLHRYRQKLVSSIGLAAEELNQKLVIRGKIISLDTFVEVFSQPSLATPSGIRQFVIEHRNHDRVLVSPRNPSPSRHLIN